MLPVVKCESDCVFDAKADIGECLVWSSQDGALYWQDIDNPSINRFYPSTGLHQSWKLPSQPGCFGITSDGRAVIAMRTGIFDFSFSSGKMRLLSEPPFDPANYRFNDGRCDPNGRLWVASFDLSIVRPGATTGGQVPTGGGNYYVFDGVKLHEAINSVTAPNGCAFSPDGSLLYRSESLERAIYIHDFDTETGRVGEKRLFAKIPDELGIPDGATIDSEGGYWSALPSIPDASKSGIARFDAAGNLDKFFPTPGLFPTMPAFGGTNLSELYFTTISDVPHIRTFLQPGEQLELHPQSGGVFQLHHKTPHRGVREPFFRDLENAGGQAIKQG